MLKTTSTLAFLTTVLLALPAAQGAPGSSGERPGGRFAEPGITVRSRSSFEFPSDLDDVRGSVDAWRNGLGATLRLPLDESTTFLFGADYEESHYDFHGAGGLLAGGGDPFDDLHSLDLSVTALHEVGEDLVLALGLTGGWALESGAEPGDAFTMGVRGGLRTSLTEELAGTFGLAVRGQIEESPLVLPYFAFSWKPGGGFTVGVTGPGLEAGYVVAPGASLAAGVTYVNRRYRLRDDDVARSAVFADEAFSPYLAFRYRAGPDVSLELTAGALLGRDLEIEDRRGRNGRDFDVKPTPYLSLRLTIRF